MFLKKNGMIKNPKPAKVKAAAWVRNIGQEEIGQLAELVHGDPKNELMFQFLRVFGPAARSSEGIAEALVQVACELYGRRTDIAGAALSRVFEPSVRHARVSPEQIVAAAEEAWEWSRLQKSEKSGASKHAHQILSNTLQSMLLLHSLETKVAPIDLEALAVRIMKVVTRTTNSDGLPEGLFAPENAPLVRVIVRGSQRELSQLREHVEQLEHDTARKAERINSLESELSRMNVEILAARESLAAAVSRHDSVHKALTDSEHRFEEQSRVASFDRVQLLGKIRGKLNEMHAYNEAGLKGAKQDPVVVELVVQGAVTTQRKVEELIAFTQQLQDGGQ